MKARREVILCGGAICTPQLLMLRYVIPPAQLLAGYTAVSDINEGNSGIGPKTQLVSQGIDAKLELPAVDRIYPITTLSRSAWICQAEIRFITS